MITPPLRSITSLTAAVAVAAAAAVLVTAAWRADAAPGDDDATFVPVAPCRLFDYRPGDQVGDRNTPLGPGETHAQQVTGDVGNCVGPAAVPPDAVGVAMNVTVAEPTAQSNLRVFPADVDEVPLASSLNWVAGQPPFPNKVDVKLSPDGAIKLTNFAGTVFVLADVVGYYTNDTLTEIDQRLTVLETGVADLERAQPFAVTATDLDNASVGVTDEAVVSLQISAPVAGQVTVNSTARVQEVVAGDRVRCSITSGTAFEAPFLQEFQSPGTPGDLNQIAGTRTFDVAAGSTTTFSLVCVHLGSGDTNLRASTLTAIFTPERD